MGYIQLLIFLLTYFARKKQGASTAEAALTGVGAAWASNWVIKNTKWGQETLAPLNDKIGGWLGVSSGTVSGGTVTDSDGNVIPVPAGHMPVQQPDGSVVFVPNNGSGGSWFDSLAGTLKSWGAQGTATVLGTAGVLSGKISPWLIGGAIVAAVAIAS